MIYEWSEEYVLTQDGKNFVCDTKIKINRFSNKTERLVFKFDGSIPSYLDLYVAFTNPKTDELTYEPILHDTVKDEWFIIIGSSVSFYVGVWGLTVVGVQEDYPISEAATIDETLIFYASNPFKLVVLKQLICDDAVQLSYPNLEQNLLDIHVLHDNVVDLAVETAEYHAKCVVLEEKCQEHEEQCLEYENQCREYEERCHEHEENCLEHREHCADSVAQCQTLLTDCRTTLSNCQAILAQCQTIANQLSTLQANLNAGYIQYSNQLRDQYESYISILQELRGE